MTPEMDTEAHDSRGREISAPEIYHYRYRKFKEDHDNPDTAVKWKRLHTRETGPRLPVRLNVPDEHMSWDARFPGYKPQTWPLDGRSQACSGRKVDVLPQKHTY
jgi:hypothetical protein